VNPKVIFAQEKVHGIKGIVVAIAIVSGCRLPQEGKRAVMEAI
jgi:hypothetical protein